MKQVIEAPRQSIFLVYPEALVLIGRDTNDGPSHPRYDVRVHNSFDEDIVLGMMKYGIKKPISVVKNGDKLEVVDGRQRVINAREANRRLQAMDAPLLRIKVLPPERGEDAKMAALMVLLNEHKIDDSAFGRGQKAQKLLDMGHSMEEVALLFKVSPQTINNYTSLLNLVPEVQALIVKGEIPATKGYELAQKNTEAQQAFLDRRANGSRSGEHKTKAPAKKTLQKVYEEGKGKLPTDFVLGVGFALGLVHCDDIAGLAALLGLKPATAPVPEPPKVVEPNFQVIEAAERPKDTVRTELRTVLVGGKPVDFPVKVCPPGEDMSTAKVHVKGYGTPGAIS